MGNCLTHYYDNPKYYEELMANCLTIHIKDCDVDSLEFYKELNDTLFELCNKLNFKTYKYIDVLFKQQCVFQITNKNVNLNTEFNWLRDFLTHNQYYNQIINKFNN